MAYVRDIVSLGLQARTQGKLKWDGGGAMMNRPERYEP